MFFNGCTIGNVDISSTEEATDTSVPTTEATITPAENTTDITPETTIEPTETN